MKKIAVILFLAAAAFAATDYSADGARWWSHVQFLADDKLEGRAPGTPGYRKAAEYVAKQFDSTGLKPAGTKGFYQPVAFERRRLVEESSSLHLVKGGESIPLKLGEHATLSTLAEPGAEGQGYFLGYGLQIPDMKIDDLAGLDLKGKVAVYLSGSAPREVPGPLAAHYGGLDRWKAHRAAGLIGGISFANPKNMDVPWERSSLRRLQPAVRLADPALNEMEGVKIGGVFNPKYVNMIFEGSGHTLEEILALHEAGKPLPKFPLKVSFRANPKIEFSTMESDNVAALMPGSDPKLKNEIVVLSAHLDHLGVGGEINGDKIYNGALDNASGIATLLEVARAVSKSSKKPRRSLLFVAVTGEESGLLGSKYIANYPTVKQGQIVANVNMDMFLPIHALKSVVGYGTTESDLGPLLEEVAKGMGLQVQPDREPQRNLFVRSDQYSFIRKGVPALALKFGSEPGSKEEQLAKDWIKTRYHAPSDDLAQPVDLEAAAQFNELMLAMIVKIADRDERPRWNENSFFKRFEKK